LKALRSRYLYLPVLNPGSGSILAKRGDSFSQKVIINKCGSKTLDEKRNKAKLKIPSFYKVVILNSVRIRLRIQYGQWIRIRIRNPDPDSGEHKSPTKIENNYKKCHVLKCWMFSFEG